MIKRDAAIEFMESKEDYEKGISAAEDGDTAKAIKYLSKVPKKDQKRYKKAVEELEDIEEVMALEVQDIIDKGELSEAKKIVNTYLKIVPNSVKMKIKMDNIHAKNTEAEKRIKAAEQAQKNKEAEALVEVKKFEEIQNKNNEAANTASSLVGTYKSVVSEVGNLRDAPSLKGNLLAALPRGTNVYIHDTQVESPTLIWCLVEPQGYYRGVGWLSYNTMNYRLK